MKYHFLAHIAYILESIEAIRQYVGADILAALEDRKTYDAVLHRLETLAESASKLPEDIKAQHSHIPWQSIAGFRNILAHDYLGDIDHGVLVGVITNRLADLYQAMHYHLPEWPNVGKH